MVSPLVRVAGGVLRNTRGIAWWREHRVESRVYGWYRHKQSRPRQIAAPWREISGARI